MKKKKKYETKLMVGRLSNRMITRLEKDGWKINCIDGDKNIILTLFKRKKEKV